MSWFYFHLNSFLVHFFRRVRARLCSPDVLGRTPLHQARWNALQETPAFNSFKSQLSCKGPRLASVVLITFFCTMIWRRCVIRVGTSCGAAPLQGVDRHRAGAKGVHQDVGRRDRILNGQIDPTPHRRHRMRGIPNAKSPSRHQRRKRSTFTVSI